MAPVPIKTVKNTAQALRKKTVHLPSRADDLSNDLGDGLGNDLGKERRQKIVSKLELWFQKNARKLPWRLSLRITKSNPYPVWLSEIMLQQTVVKAVIPYFEKFLQSFPLVTDLADATIDEVYAHWAGLGYYSRARNLHKGAIAIAERLRAGLDFPQTRDEWLAIPGVGEYTSGAVTSIAYNQKEALVDGNVERVLCRLNAWEERDPKKVKVWQESKLLVQLAESPRDFNQSLMELGALICRPKAPLCLVCPVQHECLGKIDPERFPCPKKKVIWKHEREEKWILIAGTEKTEKEILLIKGGENDWREGLWDLPDSGSKDLGIDVKDHAILSEEFTEKHVVTNHKIERRHLVFKLKKSTRVKNESAKWFRLSELPAVPAPVKKALKRLQN